MLGSEDRHLEDASWRGVGQCRVGVVALVGRRWLERRHAEVGEQEDDGERLAPDRRSEPAVAACTFESSSTA